MVTGFRPSSFPSGSGSGDSGRAPFPSSRSSFGSPKGILKTERRVSKPVELHWDEATIAEHDVDRGTRTKIEEPKTPYHRPRDDMEDSGEEDDVAAIKEQKLMLELAFPGPPSPEGAGLAHLLPPPCV